MNRTEAHADEVNELKSKYDEQIARLKRRRNEFDFDATYDLISDEIDALLNARDEAVTKLAKSFNQEPR